ncbi:hypothetical protein RSAG8_05625, partial [Rhizoctonia solani AG-8 WAC10335]
MESRKRAKQPVEGDEGSTGVGTGSPSNTLARVNPVDNEQVGIDEQEDGAVSRVPPGTSRSTGPHEQDSDSLTCIIVPQRFQCRQKYQSIVATCPPAFNRPASTNFAMAINQNLPTSQTAEHTNVDELRDHAERNQVHLADGSHTPRNPQVNTTKRKCLKWLGTSGVLRPLVQSGFSSRYTLIG